MINSLILWVNGVWLQMFAHKFALCLSVLLIRRQTQTNHDKKWNCVLQVQGF